MSGPMADVVFHSLQYLKREELASMIEYLASLQQPPDKLATPTYANARLKQARYLEGEILYGTHCEDCHGASGEGQERRYPALAGNHAVLANPPPTPSSP